MASEVAPSLPRPRVFISYTHDSPEHAADVLRMSERLRGDGIDTILDQYVKGTPAEGWPRWMLNQLEAADFVLLVCTKTYYDAFRGKGPPDARYGGDWEGRLITDEMYQAKSATTRFAAVMLDEGQTEFIPEVVASHTTYLLTIEARYFALLDYLLGRAGVKPGSLGDPNRRPRPRRRWRRWGLVAAPIAAGAAAAAIIMLRSSAPAATPVDAAVEPPAARLVVAGTIKNAVDGVAAGATVKLVACDGVEVEVRQQVVTPGGTFELDDVPPACAGKALRFWVNLQGHEIEITVEHAEPRVVLRAAPPATVMSTAGKPPVLTVTTDVPVAGEPSVIRRIEGGLWIASDRTGLHGTVIAAAAPAAIETDAIATEADVEALLRKMSIDDVDRLVTVNELRRAAAKIAVEGHRAALTSALRERRCSDVHRHERALARLRKPITPAVQSLVLTTCQ